MPNTEPVAGGARPASSHRVNRPPGADWAPRAASPPAARQLPRGQRRWPRRSGPSHSERVRARACRLTAGASRPSRGERRPWSSKIQLARALTSPPSRRRLARGARAAGRRGESRGSRTRPPGRAAGPPRRRCRSSLVAACHPPECREPTVTGNGTPGKSDPISSLPMKRTYGVISPAQTGVPPSQSSISCR
eukprot:scaffold102559_cov57-Phaeocystis_antarctica.AAC.3